MSDYRESELRDAYAALQKDRNAWASRAVAAKARVKELEEWRHNCAMDLLDAKARVRELEAMAAEVMPLRKATTDRLVAAELALEAATKVLGECRELFVELRGDWSDNRGPCREGLAIIDAALAGEDAP